MQDLEPTVVAALIGVIGIAITQFLSYRKWSQQQRINNEHLKQELKTQREVEREKDRIVIESARSAIVDDATKMVDRYEASAKEAHEHWQECERDHRMTREDLSRMHGRLDEIQNRLSENERVAGITEAKREKDRHIKHQALNGLARSELVIQSVLAALGHGDMDLPDPLTNVIDSWEPTYDRLTEENVMPVTRWLDTQHARRYVDQTGE